MKIRDIKLTDSIFFNSLPNKKTNNKPNINKTNGILLPESKMPTPRIPIAVMLYMRLRIFLFLSLNAIKSIEKKEKF